jgi:hypothetical protein
MQSNNSNRSETRQQKALKTHQRHAGISPGCSGNGNKSSQAKRTDLQANGRKPQGDLGACHQTTGTDNKVNSNDNLVNKQQQQPQQQPHHRSTKKTGTTSTTNYTTDSTTNPTTDPTTDPTTASTTDHKTTTSTTDENHTGTIGRRTTGVEDTRKETKTTIRGHSQATTKKRQRNDNTLLNGSRKLRKCRHTTMDPTTERTRDGQADLGGDRSKTVYPTKGMAVRRPQHTESGNKGLELGRQEPPRDSDNNNSSQSTESNTGESRSNNSNNHTRGNNRREEEEVPNNNDRHKEQGHKDILQQTTTNTNSQRHSRTTTPATATTTATTATTAATRTTATTAATRTTATTAATRTTATTATTTAATATANNRHQNVITVPPRQTPRHRPNKNTKNRHHTLRIGSINCGGRKGWLDGSILIMEALKLDILIILDTKLQKTPLTPTTTKYIISDTYSESTRSSSLLILSPQPQHWKITQQHSSAYGGYIRITNGRERIQGLYARPTNEWNKDTDRQNWLQDCIRWTKANKAMTIGDLNARHRSWDLHTKPRGTWVFKQCQQHDIHITTSTTPTNFTKTGHSNVDICLTHQWTKIEPTAYDTSAVMPADHQMLIVEGMRNSKQQEPTQQRLTHSAGNNTTTTAKYQTKAAELYQQLTHHPNTDKDTIISNWTSILFDHFQQSRRKAPIFWTNECQEASNLCKVLQKTRDLEGLKSAHKAKRAAIKDAKHKIQQQSLSRITTARPGETAQQISLLTNWRRRKDHTVDPKAFLQLLAQKSGEMTNRPVGNTPIPHPLPPNIMPALTTALNNAAKHKAPGLDGITTEALKADPTTTQNLLLLIIQQILTTGELPDTWTKAEIIPVPKVQTPTTNPKDYRPVALLSHMRKIVERAVANEIKTAWILEEGQHGYQKGTGTEMATQIAHTQLQRNKNHRMICLDLSGAFDKACRDTIVTEIGKLPLHQGWKQLATIFTTTPVWMQLEGHGFWTKDGVAQGSALSPILWNIFINTLQRQLNKHVTAEIPQPSIIYADDISITFDKTNTTTAQKLLDICTEWADKHNAVWNVNKCTIITEEKEDISLQLSGQQLPQTQSTNYLGLPFNTTGIDYNKHIDQSIAKAQTKASQLLGLGIVSSRGRTNNAELSVPAAVSVFKAFIRPILEYGNAQNTQSTTNLNKLNECHDTLLQKLLGVESRHPKAIRAATRMTTMTDRLQELNVSLINRLHKQDTRAGRQAYSTLRSLSSSLTDTPSTINKTKKEIIEGRQQTWKHDVGHWKFHPPWNHGLPPALYVEDVRLSRWILKWYLGSATQNLSQEEQDEAFPNIRETMRGFLQDSIRWTETTCKSNTRFLKSARNNIMKALNNKKKQERQQKQQDKTKTPQAGIEPKTSESKETTATTTPTRPKTLKRKARSQPPLHSQSPKDTEKSSKPPSNQPLGTSPIIRTQYRPKRSRNTQKPRQDGSPTSKTKRQKTDKAEELTKHHYLTSSPLIKLN